MNVENFKKALDQIKAHPETWDQSSWHCGTKHCIAGWGQILSGKSEDEGTVRRDARVFFDLTVTEADRLFRPTATIEEFEEALKGESRFNRPGFNRPGFNRPGFNRPGFNRPGFNRPGFNRPGFNRDGFNRDGYSRDGLDVNNKPKPEAA